MQSETDYYTVLRLKPGSSIDEVRRQYRRLAKVYHPDRNPGEEEWCAEQLTAVNKAYEYLSNPQSKAAYDKAYGASGPQGSNPPHKTTPPPSSNQKSTQKQDYALKKVVTRDEDTYHPPTAKRVAIMLLGGVGVGTLGALLSMGLFSYLHPPQSNRTVLPTATLYQRGNRPQIHHSVQEPERRQVEPQHIVSRSNRQSETEKLNRLGVQVPANEFSKQELHDMAARLQNYDKSH